MSQKNVVFKHRIEYLNQFCQRHLVKGNYISIQFPIQLSVFNIENAPVKLADISCFIMYYFTELSIKASVENESS